jgi:DNA-binding transcriptional LysR family regulator
MLNGIDLSRIDLNLLVLLAVLLEERHVGRAADRLNLSPSAVSHSLARLRRVFNDPLFLRTPKGIVPTERATELAAPIAEVLDRIRGIVAASGPFAAATSARRFTIGAPDAVSAVFLPTLLATVRERAPRIDIRVRQLLPPLPGRGAFENAWQPVLANLETGAIDIAVVPVDDVPTRFVDQVLYEEDFVIAVRAGHPFAENPSLERYCEMQHVVVSQTGDDHGLLDIALAGSGLSRRVVLTVPTFVSALAVIAETDLVGAVPRRFLSTNLRRFKLEATEPPIPLERSRIRAIATKAAMMDAGLAWLFNALAEAVRGIQDARTQEPSQANNTTSPPAANDSQIVPRAKRKD